MVEMGMGGRCRDRSAAPHGEVEAKADAGSRIENGPPVAGRHFPGGRYCRHSTRPRSRRSNPRTPESNFQAARQALSLPSRQPRVDSIFCSHRRSGVSGVFCRELNKFTAACGKCAPGHAVACRPIREQYLAMEIENLAWGAIVPHRCVGQSSPLAKWVRTSRLSFRGHLRRRSGVLEPGNGWLRFPGRSAAA